MSSTYLALSTASRAVIVLGPIPLLEEHRIVVMRTSCMTSTAFFALPREGCAHVRMDLVHNMQVEPPSKKLVGIEKRVRVGLSWAGRHIMKTQHIPPPASRFPK